MTARPVVQVALDVTDTASALRLADDALAAGADWLEVGNPLIKFEGVRALRAVREAHPDAYILADLMILAGSERYVDMAVSTGMNNITVAALAPDHTVEEAVRLGRDRGLDVTVDLFNKPDVLSSALRYQDMGASHLMVHFGTDEKRKFPAGSPLDLLGEVVRAVWVPVSYATYDGDEARGAVTQGASIIVQGAPLISAPERVAALTELVTTVRHAAREESR